MSILRRIFGHRPATDPYEVRARSHRCDGIPPYRCRIDNQLWPCEAVQPHQVMPGHDPEPTTSYRRTPVDPQGWDAHCATALWNARPSDTGGAA